MSPGTGLIVTPNRRTPKSVVRAPWRIAIVVPVLVGAVLMTVGTAYAAGGATTIEHASQAQIGATDFGNTASPGMAPDSGSPISANCPAGSSIPSHEQVWEVNLVEGDQVTITGGYSPPATSMEIAFWAAGTNDAEVLSGNVPRPDFVGSNIGGYGGGSLGQSPIVFTVTSTGTYPFAVGNCDGSTGPYQFDLTVQEPRIVLREINGYTKVVDGETTGVLTAYAHTQNNYVLSNVSLRFVLQCRAEPNIKCGSSTTAPVTKGYATAYFSPIASLKGGLPPVVDGEVEATSPGYEGGGLLATFRVISQVSA